MMRFTWPLGIMLLLPLLLAAGCGEDTPQGTNETEIQDSGEMTRQEFVVKFRAALEKRDVDAILGFWCWDGTKEKDRLPIRRSVEADFANTIVDVRVEPMKDGQLLQYTLKGITYRPNLKPLGNLVVEFEKTGSAVQATSTSYLLGQKNGTYLIATAAAVVEKEAIKNNPKAEPSPQAKDPYDSRKFKTRLLESTADHHVWGVDFDEIKWAERNVQNILDRDFQITPHYSGGLMVTSVRAGSIGAARGLVVGDILKSINEWPVKSLDDLEAALHKASRRQTPLRFTIERAGKTILIEYRKLPKRR